MLARWPGVDSSLASLTRWASPPERVVAGWPIVDVAEADPLQGLQLVRIAGTALKKLAPFLDRHVQDVGDMTCRLNTISRVSRL